MSQASSVSAHGGIGTPEEIAYEARAQEGSIWTGGRVLMGVFAFAFAALAFAYFYLRSSNNLDMWRPHNMTAPTAAGSAIMSLAVASALLAAGTALELPRGYERIDMEAELVVVIGRAGRGSLLGIAGDMAGQGHRAIQHCYSDGVRIRQLRIPPQFVGDVVPDLAVAFHLAALSCLLVRTHPSGNAGTRLCW